MVFVVKKIRQLWSRIQLPRVRQTMRMNHSLFILLFTVVHMIAVYGDKCEQVDGKTLLQGCELLKGLVIKSQGGTLVNDSNCDVLLPKLIFASEPRVYFDKADPVSILFIFINILKRIVTYTHLILFQKKFYTVMTIDPDAPNHTPGNFYLHMIKSNIEVSIYAMFYSNALFDSMHIETNCIKLS